MDVVLLKHYSFQLMRKPFYNLEKKECCEPTVVELMLEKNEAVGLQTVSSTASELLVCNVRSPVVDVKEQLKVFLENVILAAANFCLKGKF